jgi:hypothetical protein
MDTLTRIYVVSLGMCRENWYRLVIHYCIGDGIHSPLSFEIRQAEAVHVLSNGAYTGNNLALDPMVRGGSVWGFFRIRIDFRIYVFCRKIGVVAQ